MSPLVLAQVDMPSSTFYDTHGDCSVLCTSTILPVFMMPYELLRALHSRNSTRYSHIVKLALPFHAHIGTGPKILRPLSCKHKGT